MVFRVSDVFNPYFLSFQASLFLRIANKYRNSPLIITLRYCTTTFFWTKRRANPWHWFLGLSVSWFLSFLVSWLIGLRVSWFRSFKVLPKHNFKFLIDLDRISKMLEKLLDGSAGFLGAEIFSEKWISENEIYENNTLWNLSRDLFFVTVSWCLKT